MLILITLSIALQLGAAFLALRLIPLTGRRTAWMLISFGLALMAIRRIVSYAEIDQNHELSHVLLFEGLGLIVSAAMFTGVLLIRQYFLYTATAEQTLAEQATLNAEMADLSTQILVAKTLEQIADLTLEKALRLTGSAYGYVGYIDPATGYLVSPTLVRSIWEQCQMSDKKVVFEQFTGLWGWVLQNKKSLLSNDPTHDPRSSGTPAGHVPIQRFLAVPAMHGEALVGQIALANAKSEYTGQHLLMLERLAAIYALGVRRQQAEQALGESEERFRTMFEGHASVMLLIEPVSGQIIDANQAAEAFYGYPRAVLCSMNIEMINALPSAEASAARQQAASQQRNMFIFPHRLASGEVRTVEVHSSPIDIQGQQILFSVISDVTDRQKTEQELKERQQYLIVLNEIAQAALASQDIQATMQALVTQLAGLVQADNCYVTRWDEAQQRTIPVTASGAVGETYKDSPFTPNEKTMTASVLRAGHPLAAEDAWNSPYIDREIAACYPSRSLLGVPLRAAGQNLGALLIGFDEQHHFNETEITRCEQAANLIALAIVRLQLLEETRQRAKELEALASVSAAMRIARTRAEIRAVVLKQLVALFQADGAALITQQADSGDVIVTAAHGTWKAWSGRLLPVGQHRQLLAQILDQPYLNNQSQALVAQLLPDVPQDAQALASAPLIVDQNRIGSLWLGRGSPISEAELRLLTAIGDIVANALHRSALHEDLAAQFETLQKTQARLLQSEKLAAIGELVAGVAHELNNPLTSIVLHAQLLQAKTTDRGIGKDMDQIVRDSLWASKIVRGLLEFARQHPSEHKPIQVNNILHNALELLAYELRTHKIRVETHYDPDPPATLADPYQLQQVFLNLITNAWQAIQENDQSNGLLSITTQCGPAIFEPAGPGDPPVIRIQFQDNGPGISPENLTHIFDPFFTTKQPGQGTGLGLSICHGIISEHGGHIWAESCLEQGACFFIELPIFELPIVAPETPPELPVTAKPVAAEEEKDEAAPGDLARILLVDDEASVLRIMQRSLQRGGYHVDAVSSATAGLEMLASARYDLVLCDIRMPKMSGSDFYSVIGLRYPEMRPRVIFTTGDSVSPATRLFLDKTGVPCISKPFELDELLNRVKAALHNEA
jgi:two-component system NtrC family sensor kinase